MGKLLSLAVVALALAALVSGCGQSGAGEATPPDEPPAVAEPQSVGAQAPEGGLSVEEALLSDLSTVLLIQGALVAVEGEPIRLCSALAESFPPQCGGASLQVEGLDLGAIENLESERNVIWAEHVELLGTVEDGTLTLSTTTNVEGTGTDSIASEPQQAPPDTGDAVAEGFVGLSTDEATRRAEEQGRPWRIGREDGEDFALTADLIPGRVTFEVDEGIVSAAIVEAEDEPLSEPQPTVPEDVERAELVAAAVTRLVTEDNGFGGENIFDRVEVAELIGSDPSRPLQPLTLELIAAALQTSAAVAFIPDANAAIDGYFNEMAQGIAVVSVDDMRIDSETAEVEIRLWCGSLCGVFLTYQARHTKAGWEILGTVGPIAMS